MSKGNTIQNTVVPSIVAFDPKLGDYIIGEQARDYGIENNTNIFNFKQHIWGSDSQYYNNKIFWVNPEGNPEAGADAVVLPAHEATKEFLKKLIAEDNALEIPEQLGFGVPAIGDGKAENYKRHIRKICDELELPPPIFYYEAVAVFHAFKDLKPEIEFSSKSILVIDIGGSTFSTCIVTSTTAKRVNSTPVGIISGENSGTKIDESLLVNWAKKNKLNKKENPESILGHMHKNSYLLQIEKMKITLSENYVNAKIEDRKNLKESFDEKSFLYQDWKKELSKEDMVLTIDDLEEVTREIASEQWIKQVQQTIIKFKQGSNKENPKLDYVVLSGGGSQLPGLINHFQKAITQEIKNRKNIIHLEQKGFAVAKGLALLSQEESPRNPCLISSSNARCLEGELYLGVRESPLDDWQYPKIKSGPKIESGSVLAGCLELPADGLIKVEVELPFAPKSTTYFGLFESKELGKETIYNSPNQKHVTSLPSGSKLLKKAIVTLVIQKNTSVNASIEINCRKPKGQMQKYEIGDFELGSAKLAEGNKFLGVDLGNTNSYITEYFEPEKPANHEYPVFTVSNKARKRCEKLELILTDLKEGGDLSLEKIIEQAKVEIVSVVYHSNKMEGSPLSKGETAKLLDANTAENMSKEEQEVTNLSAAFEWMLENYESLYDQPKLFLSTINGKILDGISRDNGKIREGDVAIQGTDDWKPPSAIHLPILVEELSNELKEKGRGRNFLQFAVDMHTKFVSIHPYSDGNGRTGRILLDAIFLNSKCPIVVVKENERNKYLNSLKASNDGQLDELIYVYCTALQSALDAIGRESYSSRIAEQDNPFLDTDNPLRAHTEAIIQAKRNEQAQLCRCFFELVEDAKLNLELTLQEQNKSFEEGQSDNEYKLHTEFEYSDDFFKELLSSSQNRPYLYVTIEVRQGKEFNAIAFAFDKDPTSKCGVSLFLGEAQPFKRYTTQPVELRKILLGQDETLITKDREDKKIERKIDFILNGTISSIALNFFPL
jgi:molecular chaperone DnaK (HSP70)